MTVLGGGFFDFGGCLEQVGDLGISGDAFTARLYALRGGDGGGISAVVLRALPAEGGAAVLIGSLHFLDHVPCSAWIVATKNPEGEGMRSVIGSVRHLEKTHSRIWPQSSASLHDCWAPK